MAKKAPRRTAQRILEESLSLFNRYGEPNTSTNMIAAQLSISPGNLYYHYPTKENLISTLFDQFEGALGQVLGACEEVRDVEDAWFCLHSIFELIWQYRFVYRDLNFLLSGNRHIEMVLPHLLERKKSALRQILVRLGQSNKTGAKTKKGALQPTDKDRTFQENDAIERAATSMVVLLTWWLSYEYVLDPRHAMEQEHQHAALLRGARVVFTQLAPYLAAPEQELLLAITAAYDTTPA